MHLSSPFQPAQFPDENLLGMSASVVPPLLPDPLGIKILAVCTALLFFKMFAIGIVQGLTRNWSKTYTVPEDTTLLAKTAAASSEYLNLLWANHAYRDDLENIPIFLALAYLHPLQPWRSIVFGCGFLLSAAMALQILLAALY